MPTRAASTTPVATAAFTAGTTQATALTQRARSAAALLTGLSPEKVDRLAILLGKEGRALAELSVPEMDAKSEARSAPSRRPDAGE